jgi:integrase
MKDAKIVRFRRYDLRRTFASRLRQKCAKQEDIAEALGHKTSMMSKRFAHLEPAWLNDVVVLQEQELTGPKTDSQIVGEGTQVSQAHVQ